MTESKSPELVSEVVGALLVAWVGLMIVVLVAQSLMPTLYATFAVPLVMAVCVGYCIIKDRGADKGRAILYGGIITMMGLTFL